RVGGDEPSGFFREVDDDRSRLREGQRLAARTLRVDDDGNRARWVDLQELWRLLLTFREIDPVDPIRLRTFFEQDCGALAVRRGKSVEVDHEQPQGWGSGGIPSGAGLALRPVVLVDKDAQHARALAVAVALHLHQHGVELRELGPRRGFVVEGEHHSVAAAHVVPEAVTLFDFDLEPRSFGHDASAHRRRAPLRLQGADAILDWGVRPG